ncbi:MAG: hypothetical protein SF069_16350 [Phycisphaerae bacterium]|nr:hypothetical protein [Phycisphaerae bacterium]
MTVATEHIYANLHLASDSAPPLAVCLAPRRAYAPQPAATARGVRHLALGGLLGADNRLALRAELLLIRPTEAPRPRRAAPIDALLAGVVRAAEQINELESPAAETGKTQTDAAQIRALWGPPRSLAPLLFCRRCGRIIQARSRVDGTPLLHRAPLADPAGPTTMPPFHLLTDAGDADVEAVRNLLLDQGRLIAQGPSGAFRSPREEDEWLSEHPCASDRDRARWDPDRGGYPYAEEWLTPISYAALPLLITPHGDTTLEAAAMASRDRRFSRESDDRRTLEALRARLGLIEPLLAQLDRRYRLLQRPLLEWRDDSAVASSAGSALLRNPWIAPVEPEDAKTHPATAFAPEGHDPALLPEGTAELLALAESEHSATLILRAFGKRDEKRCELADGLVDLSPLRGDIFCAGDRIEIAAAGGRAVLTPTGVRNADDGKSAVAVTGRLYDAWAKLQRPGEIANCTVRWHPRLGEAVDLFAVGVRMLDCLLMNDARDLALLRRGGAELRAALQAQCAPLATADARAATFERLLDAALAGCSADDLWSARAVHGDRAARAVADAGPLAFRYWRAACAMGLRLSTLVADVSYCPHRAADAPRAAGGTLLPLVELRGLMSLLEDALLHRSPASLAAAPHRE